MSVGSLPLPCTAFPSPSTQRCWRVLMLSRRTKVVQLRNRKPRLTFLHVRPQHAGCPGYLAGNTRRPTPSRSKGTHASPPCMFVGAPFAAAFRGSRRPNMPMAGNRRSPSTWKVDDADECAAGNAVGRRGWRSAPSTWPQAGRRQASRGPSGRFQRRRDSRKARPDCRGFSEAGDVRRRLEAATTSPRF